MTTRVPEREIGRTRGALRPVVVAVAFLLVGLWQFVSVSPPAAAACSTTVDSIATMRQASTVFVGQVTAVEDISRKATMQVIEIWKGATIGPTVVVNGSVSGLPQLGPNDRTYTPGATYLVVPFGSRSPYLDEACSGTMLYSPTGLIPFQYHEALGTSQPRVPQAALVTGGEDGTGSGPSPYALGGAGLLAAALMVVALRRRGRKRSDAAATSVRGVSVAPESAPRRGKKSKEQKRKGPKGRQAAPAPTPQLDVAAVAKRKKRRRRPRVRGPSASKPKRFQRSSGFDHLESMRKKARRAKGKKRRKTKATI